VKRGVPIPVAGGVSGRGHASHIFFCFRMTDFGEI